MSLSRAPIPESPIAPIILDAQLPPLSRMLSTPLVQSANFENGYLAMASLLYLLASLEYYRLAAKDARFNEDFERAIAVYTASAAATKALGGKFLEAVLTAKVEAAKQGEEK